MMPTDVPKLVEIHMISFNGFFLTFLGRRFLALLYENISLDPDGIVLVACAGTTIQGFVAGVLHQSGFYKRLLAKHKWAFARAALGAVVQRPSIIPRLLRALRRPDDARVAAAEACLMSIAVYPEAQGNGIGRQLVIGFNEELHQRGATSVCLTTDRDYNEKANHFYQNLGFYLSSTYTTPEGRGMNEYVLTWN